MKALITGINGFVGPYLREELENHGYNVVGIALCSDNNDTKSLDLLNKDALATFLISEHVDVVFHLAAQSSVALSWKTPQKTFEINVIATINLLDCIAEYCPKTKLLLVGSSDQYGNLKEKGELVSESTILQPQTPYAISKRAQEELALLYVKTKQLSIYLTRSFNHAGAGQKTGFMIPDFASGIVAVERGEKDFLSVGNLEAKRDFTHVTDIVRAYRLIVEQGRIGEIYNVGSGQVYSAQEILDKLVALSSVAITTKQDPQKMRPSDTPVIRCDNAKLKEHTGWDVSVGIDIILEEVLDSFRNQSE